MVDIVRESSFTFGDNFGMTMIGMWWGLSFSVVIFYLIEKLNYWYIPFLISISIFSSLNLNRLTNSAPLSFINSFTNGLVLSPYTSSF